MGVLFFAAVKPYMAKNLRMALPYRGFLGFFPYPLPLPLGAVAERSEDGEGKRCVKAFSVTCGDSSPSGRAKGLPAGEAVFSIGDTTGRRSAPEKLRRLLHPLRDGYAERAAGFAVLTADACGRSMLQCFIMGLHGGWNLRLHGGQIVEFVDHGDIQLHGAGLTQSLQAG